ncbi:MAG: LysM peptidoglycan-binding domain-containing protein [Bacteroidota bacterium]
MKRIALFLFISVLLSMSSFAQVVEHTVQKKETLFSIAKSYSTTVEAILKANPGLTEAIKIGQVIKIPTGKTVVEDKKPVPNKLTHTVQKGETFYSIAKHYNLTIEELKKENPGITDNLQPGTVLVIPARGKPQEQIVEQPKKEEKYNCGTSGLLDQYNVALMIPLYLDRSYNVDTAISDDDDNGRKTLPVSLSFMPFYEGILMAADSLEKAGLSVKFYVYDVPEDTAFTASLLEKSELKNMNLIIGPFFTNNFRIVGKWAKEHEIKIVNPFSTNCENIKNNPYAIKLMCSKDAEVREQIKYINDTWPNATIFLVHNNRSKDSILLNHYRDNLDKLSKGNSKNWIEVNYSIDGMAGISKSLSKDNPNIIISIVDGEAFLNNYIRNLSELASTYPIVVFGTRNWESYSSLEGEYIMNIKLHICTNTFIDYKKQNVRNFVLNYRNSYNAEPDTFAFRGYDVTMYFMGALMKYGKNFEKCLADYHPDLLQGKYSFKIEGENGWENNVISIYRYENYRLLDAYAEPLKEVPLIEKKTR